MSFVVVLPQKRRITEADASRYLTLREKEVFKRFNSVSRAYMWFLERVATKKAIQLYLKKIRHKDIQLNLIDIVQDENGRSHFKVMKGRFIKDEQNTSISLAHIKNIAIGGIANKSIEGSLGVHVERIRNFKHSFLKAFLDKNEMKEITRYKKSYNKRENATVFWSIKEACARSKGQNFSPKEFIVKKVRKGFYEVYDKQNSLISIGFARSWSPQAGFVATEVYTK